jgi:hypothetical protein
MLTIVHVNAEQGNGRLTQQLFRLAATVILILFLYHGHDWARKVLVLLYSVAGILALAVLRSGAPIPNPIAIALCILMSIGYLACAAVLRHSSSIRDFMSSQRALRAGP